MKTARGVSKAVSRTGKPPNRRHVTSSDLRKHLRSWVPSVGVELPGSEVRLGTYGHVSSVKVPHGGHPDTCPNTSGDIHIRRGQYHGGITGARSPPFQAGCHCPSRLI